MSLFKRFKSDRSGTAVVMFGICLVPLVGAAGVAIDYSRATTVRSALQAAADQTSLSMVIAKHDGRTLDYTTVFADALAKSGSASILRSGGATLDLAGDWLITDKQFKVTAKAVIPTTLAAIFQQTVPVAASATALGTQDQTQSQITGSNLDPEAADYNELQAYCYNSTTKQRLGPLDPDKGTRMAFAKIADNTDAGVKAGPANLDIRCGTDEQVSFLLKNIREARTSVIAQRTGTPRLFYTDASKDKSGVLSYGVTFDGVTRNTLETILCDTAAQCKPKSQGGILPNNHQTGRTPAVNTKVCAPGKFIYFGWEDRIPGYPGDNSDTDFDDIRLVITCPSTITGPFNVRLVA